MHNNYNRVPNDISFMFFYARKPCKIIRQISTMPEQLKYIKHCRIIAYVLRPNIVPF